MQRVKCSEWLRLQLPVFATRPQRGLEWFWYFYAQWISTSNILLLLYIFLLYFLPVSMVPIRWWEHWTVKGRCLIYQMGSNSAKVQSIIQANTIKTSWGLGGWHSEAMIVWNMRLVESTARQTQPLGSQGRARASSLVMNQKLGPWTLSSVAENYRARCKINYLVCHCIFYCIHMVRMVWAEISALRLSSKLVSESNSGNLNIAFFFLFSSEISDGKGVVGDFWITKWTCDWMFLFGFWESWYEYIM